MLMSHWEVYMQSPEVCVMLCQDAHAMYLAVLNHDDLVQQATIRQD